MMTYCIRGTVTRTEPWTDNTGKPGSLVTITDEHQMITVATTNPRPKLGDVIEAIGGLRQKYVKGHANPVLTRATLQTLIPSAKSETEGGETPATRREPTQGRTI